MTGNLWQEMEPGIKDPLSGAVKQLFGLDYLFPYQRLVVANILEAAEAAGIPVRWPGAENDVMAEPPPDERECPGRQIVILPTGAGKSLCFQLPAMLLEGLTLVIYPILSLMADQERRLRERGFAPVILRGGQSAGERDAVWEKLRSGQSRFIIANPEVLLTPQTLARFESIPVVHTVIDEAHCISEWGESFRPAYLEINRIIKALKPPLVTAFTATASAPVLEKIKTYIFGEEGAHRIVGNPDRPNITYAARGCMVRNLAVRDLLLVNERPAIVFCASRTGTENLAGYLRNELREWGKPWYREIRFYHAGLSREEKAGVEQWFLRNGAAVLVATCAFGMGVDKADIRTVIHRDCPPSVEAYLQESGRAGRDGLRSQAILLWGPGDETRLERAKNEAERKRRAALLDYGRDTGHCRREALLKMLDYEGSDEYPGSPCCDVCEKQASGRLREEFSLMEFFRGNNRCFTLDEAVSALVRTEQVHWSEEDARQAVTHLIKTGRLKKSRNIFWKDKICAGDHVPAP
jgi:ATP-dependent DNA helicase RecQ